MGSALVVESGLAVGCKLKDGVHTAGGRRGTRVIMAAVATGEGGEETPSTVALF